MKLGKSLMLALTEVNVLTAKMPVDLPASGYHLFFASLLEKYVEDTGDKRLTVTGFCMLHRISSLVKNAAFKKCVKQLCKQHMVLHPEIFLTGISVGFNGDESTQLNPSGKMALHLMPLVEVASDGSGLAVPSSVQPCITYGKVLPGEVRSFIACACLKGSCILSSIWGGFFAIDKPRGVDIAAAFSPLVEKSLKFNSKSQTEKFFSKEYAVKGWNVFMDVLDNELDSYLIDTNCPLADSDGNSKAEEENKSHHSHALQLLLNVCIMSFSMTIIAFNDEVAANDVPRPEDNDRVPTDVTAKIEAACKAFMQQVVGPKVHSTQLEPVLKMNGMKPTHSVPSSAEKLARVPAAIIWENLSKPDRFVSTPSVTSAPGLDLIAKPAAADVLLTVVTPAPSQAPAPEDFPIAATPVPDQSLSPDVGLTAVTPDPDAPVQKPAPDVFPTAATPSPDQITAPAVLPTAASSPPVQMPTSATLATRTPSEIAELGEASLQDAMNVDAETPNFETTSEEQQAKVSSSDPLDDVRNQLPNPSSSHDSHKVDIPPSSDSPSESGIEKELPARPSANPSPPETMEAPVARGSLEIRPSIPSHHSGSNLVNSTGSPASPTEAHANHPCVPSKDPLANSTHSSEKESAAVSLDEGTGSKIYNDFLSHFSSQPEFKRRKMLSALMSHAPPCNSSNVSDAVTHPADSMHQTGLDDTVAASKNDGTSSKSDGANTQQPCAKNKRNAENPNIEVAKEVEQNYPQPVAAESNPPVLQQSTRHDSDDWEVVQARQKMNRSVSRREENRDRNSMNTVFDMKRNHSGNINMYRKALLGRPVETPRFELDNPDSDNEDEQDFREVYATAGSCTRGRTIHSKEELLRVDLELLYSEITSLLVDPYVQSFSRADLSLVRDLKPQQSAWFRQFFTENLELFQEDVTKAENSVEYSDHKKAMIFLEAFCQIQQNLLGEFPRLHKQENAVVEALETDDRPFYRLRVESSDQTRLLKNLTCTPAGAESNLRTSVLEKLTGMTVCVGRFEYPNRNRHPSQAMIFLLRSLSHSGLFIEDPGNERLLDDVKLKMVCNRLHVERWEPTEGSLLKIWPICSLVSHLRMLRAVHNTYRLPHQLQQTFWGVTERSDRTLLNRKLPTTLLEYEQQVSSFQELRGSVDQGCLDYIDSIPSSQCDDSQKRAILTILSEQGELKRGSSSVALTVGPPGTGKSTTIATLVGAILHHSEVGHIGPRFKQSTRLRHHRGEVCFVNKQDGIRVLITGSSNHAVDEVLRKLRSGLPDGKGGVFHPKMVRAGRNNYDYTDVVDWSLHEMALKYEHQVLSPQQEPPRLHPSRKAKLMLMEESTVVLCTNSTAGGPLLQNLNVSVGMTVIDEAAHASEADAITAIMANAKFNQHGRCHTALVGDQNQLAPVFVSKHNAVTFLAENRDVVFPMSMNRQFESLFSRLFRRVPVKYSMLRNQYRAHPALGRIQSRFMYGDVVVHPSDALRYEMPYNNADHPMRLRPLTVLDTCTNQDCDERRVGTGFINALEAQATNDLLFCICDNCDVETLKDDIIIASGYRQQVDFLKKVLHAPGNFLDRFKHLNVLIDTVDALQGTERGLVIFSLTRASQRGTLGFLKQDCRVNVATSRAKYLMVLVGDSSTYCKSPLLRTMYDAVDRNQDGTSLVYYREQLDGNFRHAQRVFARSGSR